MNLAVGCQTTSPQHFFITPYEKFSRNWGELLSDSYAMMELDLLEARQVILHAQGLASSSHPVFGSGERGALAAIEHLGYVQIDTISVVQRAHHHVLWNRVRDYQPAHLHELVTRGRVFEYWHHAASFLPMRDFRFSLPRKRLYARGGSSWFPATAENKRLRQRIRAQIRERGPQMARDFSAPEGRRSSGWFDWKPAKLALEQMFMEGELMVRERRGFAKVYDFTERVLPREVDVRWPSEREQARHLIESVLRAHGLARTDEIAYLRRGPVKKRVALEVARMLRDGELVEVRVRGLANEKPHLALPDVAVPSGPVAAQILSPFDNLVIRRGRLLEFFGLDYSIGCYTPAAKRRFGYFSLPILIAGEVVGQIDLKADRASGRLEKRELHWQRRPDAGVIASLAAELNAFARFNGVAMSVRLPSGRRSPGRAPAHP